jgi:hypothetical protein
MIRQTKSSIERGGSRPFFRVHEIQCPLNRVGANAAKPWLLRVLPLALYGCAALVKVVPPPPAASTLTMLAPPETAAFRKTRSECEAVPADGKKGSTDEEQAYSIAGNVSRLLLVLPVLLGDGFSFAHPCCPPDSQKFDGWKYRHVEIQS